MVFSIRQINDETFKWFQTEAQPNAQDIESTVHKNCPLKQEGIQVDCGYQRECPMATEFFSLYSTYLRITGERIICLKD
jgi:hypothetical protein